MSMLANTPRIEGETHKYLGCGRMMRKRRENEEKTMEENDGRKRVKNDGENDGKLIMAKHECGGLAIPDVSLSFAVWTVVCDSNRYTACVPSMLWETPHT